MTETRKLFGIQGRISRARARERERKKQLKHSSPRRTRRKKEGKF